METVERTHAAFSFRETENIKLHLRWRGFVKPIPRKLLDPCFGHHMQISLSQICTVLIAFLGWKALMFTNFLNPVPIHSGVFHWHSDPLVFRIYFHVSQKNSQNDSEGVAKNEARFGIGRVNFPYVDYLFVKICKFWKFWVWNSPLFRGVTTESLWLVGGYVCPCKFTFGAVNSMNLSFPRIQSIVCTFQGYMTQPRVVEIISHSF